MNNRDNLVPFDRTRHHADAKKLAEFTATARRLQEERESSIAIVDRLLHETPRAEWLTLAANEALHTNGALERLGQLADNLERDPAEGLAIADLATRIADSIDDAAYPKVMLAQMRAHAWKDRGRALCYLGCHEESLAALEEAVTRLSPFAVLGHDLAIVNFVRAVVLQHLRRFDEAQTLLAECRAVFREHGDWRLYGKCTLAAGNLFVRRGDYASARDVLGPFVRRAAPEAQAIARLALGWCEIHVGEPKEALAHFTTAKEAYRRLDWQLESVRASYGIGSALLRLDRLDDAIRELSFARAQFLARHLVEEAGLCGLELVEAHLLRHELDEARLLAVAIVREFTDASLSRRAIAAIATLKDAIAASSATPESVRSVQTYVAALRTDPDRVCDAFAD
jgi:tetratricopeptide (TPR) repeat protein